MGAYVKPINKSASHPFFRHVVSVMEDTRLKGILFLKRIEGSSSDVHLMRTTEKGLLSGGPFCMKHHFLPKSAVPPHIAFPKASVILLSLVCSLSLLLNFEHFSTRLGDILSGTSFEASCFSSSPLLLCSCGRWVM